jgi:mRNA interferase MazF
MTTASYNESNPFAVRFVGPRKKVAYILSHQPKSFDWHCRGARPHPWKHVSEDAFESACGILNQIIDIAT